MGQQRSTWKRKDHQVSAISEAGDDKGDEPKSTVRRHDTTEFNQVQGSGKRTLFTLALRSPKPDVKNEESLTSAAQEPEIDGQARTASWKAKTNLSNDLRHFHFTQSRWVLDTEGGREKISLNVIDPVEQKDSTKLASSIQWM